MNFCTEELGTRIEVVGRVAEEGYEVSNLLKKANNMASILKSEGTCFMVSRFVRPPVKIRLDFPTPIHISHIVIDPKVGQQISSGFKIEVDINSNSNGREDETSLYQIGREILHGPQFPSFLVFRNPRFILHRKYHNLPLAEFERHRNYPNSFGLRHPTYNACERIFSLHLTIERAEGPARLPVVGSLQIWGQPSKWSKFPEVQKLLSTWRQLSGTSKQNRSTQQADKASEEPEPKRVKLKDDLPALEVPEEFLDPITFEVLCQPVRLPCGVAIDSKTLEKYTREECSWGRCENDPFTGKVFTEDSRPLPDLALKSRIDTFLSQNSTSSVAQVPRTLGSKPKIKNVPQFQCSRIAEVQARPDEPVLPPSPPIDNQVSDTVAQEIPVCSKDFMEQELARILGGANSFKPNPHLPSILSSSIINQCFKCFKKLETNSKDVTASTFYKSTCQHIIVCRTCLIGLSKTQSQSCSNCTLSWTPSTVVKICF